jgi:NAD(P)-dependent dehydrogenase (short-subunit alcohol dehydrogenase family)
MLAVNIRSPHVLVGALAPAMAERGNGAIISIGSWTAGVGTPCAAMYTATKAAGEQLTRAWAAEFGPSGVRVNAVAPGVTITPGAEAGLEQLQAIAATTPAGVGIQAEDIAQAVLFLLSDAAKIHGVTLPVDGGLTTTRLG